MAGCFDNLTGIVLSEVPECPLGFYCPNVNVSDPNTKPVLCRPSKSCIIDHLYGAPCQDGPQGLYEPVVCQRGYYCPTPRQQLPCPQGYYCLTGTFEPKKCRHLSICPPRSVAPQDHTGNIAFIILDLIVLLFYLIGRYLDKKAEKLIATRLPLDATDKTRMINAFKKAMDGKPVFIDFEMQDISHTYKDIVLFKGLSGHIHTARKTAIMGPSGSGKTTLLRILSGKIKPTSGSLLVSGKQVDFSQLKKLYGLVPKEDIMHPELTVRENVMHSAKILAPKSWTKDDLEIFVDDMLDVMDLASVAQTIVGEERGISLSQRKRVSICLELVAAPLVVFLDEPQTGLDASSALQIVEMLDAISRIGITVIATLSNTRNQVLQSFDEVIMLTSNGGVAYFGPTEEAKDYFMSIGVNFPTYANEADVMMDLLSGRDSTMDPELLERRWSEKKRMTESRLTPEQQHEFHEQSSNLVKHRGASLLMQIVHCHNLSVLQQYRTIRSLVMELFVIVFCGLHFGVATISAAEIYTGMYVQPFRLASFGARYDQILSFILLTMLILSFATAPSGAKVFANELHIYWRKAASGHSRLGYFVGKSLASLYRIVLCATHFTGIMYAFATQVVPYGTNWLAMSLLVWCVYGVSAFVVMLAKRDHILYATITAVCLCVFSGYGVIPGWAKEKGIFFLWAIQYTYWISSANWSNILEIYKHIYDAQEANMYINFVLFNQSFDYGMAFLIGLIYRVLAFAAMLLLHRDRQR
ncbi:P-loop containing nucleoside triphosphate hydrolase protein [Gorgonomyces haynaldii]|nr:P-loop containing nucleoside triphosphate hydrolase protein [Gorgonomyces haynaldii]